MTATLSETGRAGHRWGKEMCALVSAVKAGLAKGETKAPWSCVVHADGHHVC